MGGAQVYVASPLGFVDALRPYREAINQELEQAGRTPLDPWADPGGKIERAFATAGAIADADKRRRALARLDMRAGRSNHGLLERADGVLAILDGPDVDSGTAAEVGYAAARGTPVVGLRTDTRRTGENDGCTVNLQVEYFIRLHGGAVFGDLRAAVSRLRRLADRRAQDRHSAS
jgi:nucleoside 2-deoxyribosyltransferase